VIDDKKEDFTKRVKDVDAAFDTVGGDVATRSFAVVKPGGRGAYRLGPHGASLAAPGRAVSAPRGWPRPATPRTHPASACDRSGAHTRDARVSIARGRRGAAHQRGPTPARQAGIEGEVAVFQERQRICRGLTWSALRHARTLAGRSWIGERMHREISQKGTS
jgi:hypothetical protein